jgi:hypothetical protein
MILVLCLWAAGKTPQDGPKEGSQVLLFLGAANMDPTVFSQPEEFRRRLLICELIELRSELNL